jgi:hypothetical protein
LCEYGFKHGSLRFRSKALTAVKFIDRLLLGFMCFERYKEEGFYVKVIGL